MWKALRVRFGREFATVDWIERRRSGDAYAPARTTWRKVRSHRRAEIGSSRERVRRPYISGYIFTTSDAHPDDTRFLIGADSSPIAMPARDIERLRDAERNGDFDITIAEQIASLLGASFVFTSGPFTSKHATVTEIINQGQDVALDLAGAIELRLPLAKLRQIAVRT